MIGRATKGPGPKSRAPKPSLRGEAGRVLEGLKSRYSREEGWGLVANVSSGDVDELRYADAVAVALSPMEGPRLHGFEIKVSRADWVREMRSPEKSAPIRAYCAAWWIVVPFPAKRIILSTSLELPEDVGLLEVDHGRALPLVHPVERAVEVPWIFVSALFRAGLAGAERAADPDAGAPWQPVSKAFGRTHLELACGHTVLRSSKVTPDRVACLACLDGLPASRDVVLEALSTSSGEDRRRYAAALELPAQRVAGAA